MSPLDIVNNILKIHTLEYLSGKINPFGPES